jgi:hypothetical protein
MSCIDLDRVTEGEEISAVIGPIDDLQAGTPTAVPVELTENGHPVTRSDTPAYLSFFEPVSRDVVDFPLRYDRAAGTHVAQITLPHEGRWLVEGVMRWDATTVVAFGRSSGTRIVTVGPAAASNPEATPIGPAVLGAAAASAAWLLGLASYALRRRRQTARFTSQDPLPEAG